MLPRADLNSPRPPASIEAPTPVLSSTDARQEVFHRLSQLAVGKALFASVLSQLDDGTFMVKIGDTTARMALPVGTKVGDTLSMTFIAREPRPTFLIAQQAGGGSAPALLSPAGRLIDHVLQTARQQGDTATIVAKAPLLPSSASLDPARTAAALKSTLGNSGVFYESHLHDWFSGARPAADLAREPQARLQQPLPATPMQAEMEAVHIDWGKLGGKLNDLPASLRAVLTAMREAQMAAQASGANAATDADILVPPQAPLPAVEPEAARLINQQLHALEHRQVQWRGELWPGLPMEWEVVEGDPQGKTDGRDEAGAPAQQVWTSTVRFELPTLGRISATIRLVGEHVHMQVNTASEASAGALRQHGGALADALRDAGSPLDSLTVKRDEAG